MDQAFLRKLFHSHSECAACPTPAEVHHFFNDLVGLLFPDFKRVGFSTEQDFQGYVQKLQSDLTRILQYNPRRGTDDVNATVRKFFDALPEIFNRLKEDVTAMYEGDPAAKSENEVIRTYPGFYAIAAYRIAHKLVELGVNEIPRMITEHAHSKTGIDIHPAAKIGRHFCIDHGTGIVIGETTSIGNHVKLYQGVTLGALSVSKADAERKRHPTIEDHVVIYAGATILGGETVVGKNSVIGGNVWLTASVPPSSRIYYQSKMQNGHTGETDIVVFKN